MNHHAHKPALGLALSALLAAPMTQAANWLAIQGAEGPKAEAAQFFGFIQLQHQNNHQRPVTGLSGALAPYNNQDAVFNLVAPDQNNATQTQLFRARPGLRGVIPGTDGKINYFLLAEFGNNGLTREHRPVFSDASLTFNYIPGARLRLGQFKTPTGEEALQAVNVMDYLNFSTATDQLLNERFFKAHPTTDGRAHNIPGGTLAADMTGAVGGFRDIGLQIFDWFQVGNWELTYAGMLSQGSGIDWDDQDRHLDSTLRLQASYLLNPATRGAKREDLTLFAWKQEGKRQFAGDEVNRERSGYGLTFRQGNWRAGGEYLQGKGMIFNGPNPPFNDLGAPAAEPVSTLITRNGTADGYALDIGYRLLPQTWLNLRYDIYHRGTHSPALQRDFTTWTAGIQYQFTPKLRLDFNYELRDLKVPHANAIPAGAQRNNALAIADSMADRWGLQLTWMY